MNIPTHSVLFVCFFCFDDFTPNVGFHTLKIHVDNYCRQIASILYSLMKDHGTKALGVSLQFVISWRALTQIAKEGRAGAKHSTDTSSFVGVSYAPLVCIDGP